MICVAILGIICSIAVPQYMRFQLKAKSTEAKTNLKAIRAAEEAYYSEFGSFVAAVQTPASIPGTRSTTIAPPSPGFQRLGFEPAGEVFFAYAITVSSDGVGFTAEAAGDLDDLRAAGRHRATGTQAPRSLRHRPHGALRRQARLVQPPTPLWRANRRIRA